MGHYTVGLKSLGGGGDVGGRWGGGGISKSTHSYTFDILYPFIAGL